MISWVFTPLRILYLFDVSEIHLESSAYKIWKCAFYKIQNLHWRLICNTLCKAASRKYRVSQEEWTKLRESVPYVELYRSNPKHLYPKLNGYGDNGQRKVWTSCISAYCTSTAVAHWPWQCNTVIISVTARAPPNAIRQYFITTRYSCAM